MMKKPSGNYESPLIEWLQVNSEDIVTSSGDNYFEWGWDNDKSYEDGLFN